MKSCDWTVCLEIFKHTTVFREMEIKSKLKQCLPLSNTVPKVM